MAALNAQRVVTAGTAITTAAAASGGDTAPCGERTALQVKNSHGSASRTVTIAVPGTDKFGNANPDNVVTVAAGATKLIPLRADDYADPSTGRASISYSDAAADLTVAVITL